MTGEPTTQQKIGSFVVLGKIGKGGMGAVYKAEDPALHRIVALKLLPADLAADADFVARFKNEAAAAAQLSHTHLVQVYAAGEDAGTHFIAMEFVDGESLQEYVKRHGRMPPLDALTIAMHAADALRYAWNKAKIIHRDIKPDNILLSADGDVKIADLGLAKSLSRGSVAMTMTGMVMGSPHYISPEQAQGQKAIDFHTDVYSLGCTLFDMLAGRPPFEGDDIVALCVKHVNEQPPDLAKLCPDCPPKLVQLVKRMMAKNPKERPATYDALVAEMSAIYKEIEYAETHRKELAAAKARRTTLAIYGGAAAALLLIVGFFVWNGTKSGRGQVLATVPPTPLPAAAATQPPAITPPPIRTASPGASAQPVDDDFIKAVAALPPEQQVARVMAKLKELNPAFDGTATHTTENGRVTALEFSTFEVSDISPVRALRELRNLRCSGTVESRGKLTDLSPLRELKLVELDCHGNSFSDLSPLRGMSLLKLNAGASGVDDLSHLRGMPLAELIVSHTRIRDLTPLAGMPIRTLYIGDTRVTDIASLRGTPLEFLSCDHISDLSPLKETPIVNLSGSVIAPGLDTALLRSIKTLRLIGGKPAAEFWKQVDAEAAAKGPTTTSEPAPAGSDTWTNAIDLLPLIDPQRDAVTGVWTRVAGGLMSDIGFGSRVEIPYRPPAEYDFRIVFTRLEAKGMKGTVGWGDVSQVLQKDGRPFHWYMGAHGNTWFGFDLVGGKRFDKNPTGAQAEECLQLLRRHTSVVAVRKESVKAFLDGKLIAEWRPEFGALSEGAYSNLRDRTLIGIAACNVQTVFHRVEVREVNGKGTFTRVVPAVQAPPAPRIEPAAPVSATAAPALALFAGRDTALWQDANGGAGDWAVANGELIAGKNDLLTKARFQDFRLHLEFAVPSDAKHGNSGIYLQSRYEVQILDSYGKPVDNEICGALFKMKAPDRNASKPSGEWQDYDIDFHAARFDAAGRKTAPARVTVTHNGKIIHKNAEIPEATGKGDSESPAPGPIRLQAYGSAVRFRNISICGPDVTGGVPAAGATAQVATSDEAFLKEVAALPAEQQVARVVAKLKELNPQFDGKETHKIETGAVAELAVSTVGVTDLSPLRALRWLRKLMIAPATLTQKGALVDLSPLKDLPLTMLWCHQNPIRDLAPLKGMPLTTLSITGTQVADLAPLAGMKLTTLGCNETDVAELTPLAGMPLTVLWCQSTKVAYLTPLREAPLRELRCDPAVVTQNAAVLREIKTLAKINDLPAAAILRGTLIAATPAKPTAAGSRPVRPPGAPSDALSFRDKWFRIYADDVGWLVAKKKCERLGGHLAVVPDAGTWTFLSSLIKDENIWLGATDRGHKGRWTWVDGTDMSFSEWGKDQPNNLEGRQDCLQSWGRKWDDLAEDGYSSGNKKIIHGFACEWDGK